MKRIALAFSIVATVVSATVPCAVFTFVAASGGEIGSICMNWVAYGRLTMCSGFILAILVLHGFLPSRLIGLTRTPWADLTISFLLTPILLFSFGMLLFMGFIWIHWFVESI